MTALASAATRLAEARPAALDEPTSKFDEARVARAVRELLYAIGENPDREGLVDTPKRVARAYGEIFSGLRANPTTHLERSFEHEGGADDLVLVRDIGIFSMCEHHLLPFTGRAHVAYLPGNGRVVGLSKIARMVDAYARRPQIQERLCAQIADALIEEVGARGTAVIVEGEHMCLRMRGISKPGADMMTTAVRGVLASEPSMRTIALALLRRR